MASDWLLDRKCFLNTLQLILNKHLCNFRKIEVCTVNPELHLLKIFLK